MNPEPTTPLPASPPLSSSDLLEWLRGETDDAEKALKAREQAEATWRGGTDKSWRAAGCKLSRAERIRNADINRRIAEKCRRNIEAIRAIIAIVIHSDKHIS